MDITAEDQEYFVLYKDTKYRIDVWGTGMSRGHVDEYINAKPELKAMTHGDWKRRFNEDPQEYGI